MVMILSVFAAAIVGAVLLASDPAALPVATGIAGIVAALSPVALRYVPLDGLQMAAASYVTSLAIAVAAGLLTGDLHPDRASLLAVLGGSASFWTIQQAVFKVLAEVHPPSVHGAAARRSRTVART